MQRKYIEDFSELERMLVLDMNFLRCACNGYEDRDLLICIIRIMYSIYLTFQYREDWTLQDVSNYVNTMVQYLRVGQSPQYHYINTVQIAIEHHDKKPMYDATIGEILVEPQSWHLFIGLSAMTKAAGTLKRVFEWFTRAEA